MAKKLEVKDFITYGLIALGFAVQWGVLTTKVQAQQDQIVSLSRKVDSVLEIKSDLSVLKEATLDSHERIVRIENKLLKATR